MGKTRDLFKKIRDTKGTFHANMGTIKDRNGMGLTEGEDIKTRQIKKKLCKHDIYDPGHILSPCLFNFYAEYIMQNARLDEAQAGIKIAGRNINNLRYADDTIYMAESEEEPKSLLMKESEKAGLKLNIQKTKIMVPSLHGK